MLTAIVVLSLAFGAAVGVFVGSAIERARSVERTAAIVASSPPRRAPALLPTLAPATTSARFLERASAIVDATEHDPRARAEVIALASSEAWAEGVTDLREAIARTSGIPADVLEETIRAAERHLVGE